MNANNKACVIYVYYVYNFIDKNDLSNIHNNFSQVENEECNRRAQFDIIYHIEITRYACDKIPRQFRFFFYFFSTQKIPLRNNNK